MDIGRSKNESVFTAQFFTTLKNPITPGALAAFLIYSGKWVLRLGDLFSKWPMIANGPLKGEIGDVLVETGRVFTSPESVQKLDGIVLIPNRAIAVRRKIAGRGLQEALTNRVRHVATTGID